MRGQAPGSSCRSRISPLKETWKTSTYSRLVASVLFGLTSGSVAFDAPIPSQSSCPTCAFGNWQCNRQCDPQNLDTYAFDFRYSLGRCWEEIPRDSRSMMFDADIWCSLVHTRLFLSCSNMNGYDFSGITLVKGCKSDAMGAALVRESCTWVCKSGRPVARCFWEFAHGGTIFDGRLDACWLAEVCAGSFTNVSVVCKPTTQLNASAAILVLQTDLSSALAAHSAAENKFQQAVAAHNATKDEFSKHFGNLTAQELAAKRAAEKAELESAQQSLLVARERLSGVAAELQETRRVLEAKIHQHANATAMLVAHGVEQQTLQSMLVQASAALNSTQASLSDQIAGHLQTRTNFDQVRKSLLHEIIRYGNLLKAERDAHSKTQNALRSKEEETEEARTWMWVAVLALGVLLVVCMGIVTGLLIRQRKWKSLALTAAEIRVLGRPVGGNVDAEERKFASADSEAWPANPGDLSYQGVSTRADGSTAFGRVTSTGSAKTAWS